MTLTCYHSTQLIANIHNLSIAAHPYHTALISFPDRPPPPARLLKFTVSFRSISAAAGSEPPDQFVHIIKAVSLVSENQAQLGHVVRALQDKDKMRDCEEQEEKEGRMNCDLLDRFIVIGGPFFEPGDDLQAKLQEQVAYCQYNPANLIVCQVHFKDFCEYRPDLIATAKTIKRTHS